MLFGPDASELAADWNNLASTYVKTHRYAEAEHAYGESQRLLLRDPDAPQARLVWIKWGLSRALWGQGRFEEARRAIEEARAVAARTLGPEHQMFGDLVMEQGIAALREGRPREALAPLDTALPSCVTGAPRALSCTRAWRTGRGRAEPWSPPRPPPTGAPLQASSGGDARGGPMKWSTALLSAVPSVASSAPRRRRPRASSPKRSHSSRP